MTDPHDAEEAPVAVNGLAETVKAMRPMVPAKDFRDQQTVL